MNPLERYMKQLDELDGRTVEVNAVAAAATAGVTGQDIAELAQKIARELSKPGGPQIAQRAIANR